MCTVVFQSDFSGVDVVSLTVQRAQLGPRNRLLSVLAVSSMNGAPLVPLITSVGTK